VTGLVTLNTVCLFFYRQLDYVANAHHRSALLTFSEEAAGGLAGLAVFPLVYQAAIHFPLVSARWRVHLAAHLLAVCLISILHTTLIAVLRMSLFPLIGFGKESYGYMPARYPMEFSHFFIYYWISVGLIYLFHEVRFARDREVRHAKLESILAEAQLQNLRLQLEPHFLFNALNAISAALYEDVRLADEMIGRLGELLRQLLKGDRSQYVPLSREIEILQLYTRIMQARLEERLTVSVEVEESVRMALVPQLIFQPLVENAIRHGMDSRFEASVFVRAYRQGEELCLTVRDHGPGIDRSAPLIKGIGLRNTIERLQRGYGNAHRFEICNARDGGALVTIRLPLRMSDGQEQTTHPAFVAERGDR
jgi:two-component system LytT family sensor kinase